MGRAEADTDRVDATLEVILRGEEDRVSDEDEHSSEDEGEEQLHVDEVARAVEPPGEKPPHQQVSMSN